MFVTDHAPLQWLNRMIEFNPCLMQWYLALQPYQFTIQYRKDCDHSNADFLSCQMAWNALDQQASRGGGVGVGIVSHAIWGTSRALPRKLAHPLTLYDWLLAAQKERL